MNIAYGEVLKSLKNCDFKTIPPQNQEFAAEMRVELKNQSEDIRVCRLLVNELQAENDPDKRHLINFTRGRLAVHLDQCYRSKRFMLIYHNTRLSKLQEHYWHFGGNLLEEAKKNLAEIEKNYYNDYKALAVSYMDQVGLQLTVDLDPPLDLSVEAKFLQDCGQILNQEGQTLKLDKNSVLYIKKRYIQNFIKQGKAQIIIGSVGGL